MSLNHEALLKMKKNVLSGMVLDYKEMFDLTLFAIKNEVRDLKAYFNKLEYD